MNSFVNKHISGKATKTDQQKQEKDEHIFLQTLGENKELRSHIYLQAPLQSKR